MKKNECIKIINHFFIFVLPSDNKISFIIKRMAADIQISPVEQNSQRS